MIESSERGARAGLSNVSGNLQSCKSREVNTSINRVSAGTDLRDEPPGVAKVLSVVLKHGPLGTVASPNLEILLSPTSFSTAGMHCPC